MLRTGCVAILLSARKLGRNYVSGPTPSRWHESFIFNRHSPPQSYHRRKSITSAAQRKSKLSFSSYLHNSTLGFRSFNRKPKRKKNSWKCLTMDNSNPWPSKTRSNRRIRVIRPLTSRSVISMPMCAFLLLIFSLALGCKFARGGGLFQDQA
jgi:hypothetical protein